MIYFTKKSLCATSKRITSTMISMDYTKKPLVQTHSSDIHPLPWSDPFPDETNMTIKHSRALKSISMLNLSTTPRPRTWKSVV